MRFFDREEEIAKLRQIRLQSEDVAQFTVITGRRRIGKTSLVIKAYDGEPFLYFFVARSSESELCQEFAGEISQKLGVPILGRVERFADLFQFVMDLSRSQRFTLLIDEFQDFSRVNGAIFSQMQRIWDLNKESSHLNLVVCGSVFSMMTKLFRNHQEPLYGRQTNFFNIEPFAPSVLKEIIGTYNAHASAEDLLMLYSLTGGVAKYVELLMDGGPVDAENMLERVLEKNSYFIPEGKNMLIEEFGRDYGRYFDILKLIANGHNTRGDIEGILHAEIAGYLSRLESDYGLIAKNKPMLQQSSNKNIHYSIQDPFLRFWFRFIYKYNSFVEANAFGKLFGLVRRDYPTYSGRLLELYFKASMRETGNYTQIDSWWERKGENEIDIIAVDDLARRVEFYEVKRQRDEIDFSVLEKKVNRFMEVTGQFRDYDTSCRGLSMEDM